jgi:hypothetical protein
MEERVHGPCEGNYSIHCLVGLRESMKYFIQDRYDIGKDSNPALAPKM